MRALETAGRLESSVLRHVREHFEEEARIAYQFLRHRDGIEVHQQIAESEIFHESFLGFELFRLALLEQLHLAVALGPLIEEIVEVEIGGRLRRLRGHLLRRDRLLIAISKQFRRRERTERHRTLPVPVMRVHEVILVLAGKVPPIEHVLPETAGGPGCGRGMSCLAHGDVLGEERRALLVDEHFHVNEDLGQVRTRGRQCVDPLVNAQEAEPLLELLELCQLR